ncbi:TPA: hypothetical protein ACIPUI_004345, partial [Citrobacter freundii]
KVVLYQLSYSRLIFLFQGLTRNFPIKFVAVVIRISASLREAHYTRNLFACNPSENLFFDFWFNR